MSLSDGRDEPKFVDLMRDALLTADVTVRGIAERWIAPVAIYDIASGFGEESWLEASPETLFAWNIGGADVVCEHGAAAGARSVAGDGMVSLTLRGMPSRFRAESRVQCGQFYFDDRLVERITNSIGCSRPWSSQSLRNDLTLFHDSVLLDHLNHYAIRASSPVPPTTVEMEARTLLIVEHLLTRHHDVRSRSRTGGLAPRQLKRASDYLMAHLAEDVALVELAAIADLSPHHFCRAFKQSTGLPPHAWLVARRMERAQDLMIGHPDMGLIEIALAVGYQSQAAFGAAFRRATGLSPGQWRRGRAK